MDSIRVDPGPSVADFDIEVIEHIENLAKILSTLRESRVFVNESDKSSHKCTLRCPEEGVARVFTPIEKESDLLSHGFRTRGVGGRVIESLFPLRELPSDELSHRGVKKPAEEVPEEQEGVDLDFAKDVVDPRGANGIVVRSEHGWSLG